MTNDVRQNTPIDAWLAAHKGETFRLLAGNIQREQNANLQEALKYFDLAIKQDPNFIWVIAHLGLTHRQLGNLDKAIGYFQSVINNAKGEPWGYAQLGETYRCQMARSNPDEDNLKRNAMNAINNFQEAIKRSKGEYAWAYAHLGTTYCQLALSDKSSQNSEYWKPAQTSLDTAIAQTQERYAWAYAYGYIVEYQGFRDYEKARRYLERANLLDSRVIPHTTYQMGLLYQRNEEYDKAIETYTQGLQQEAEKRFVLYGIAVATVRQKGLNEASTEISTARQELESRRDSFALYMLAALATLELQYDQAQNYAQEARDNLVIDEADSPTGKLIYLQKNDLSWLGLSDDELNILKP